MRVAIIGAGAIADSFHLPALQAGAAGQCSLTIVDPDLDRARDLARKCDADGVAPDHGEVLSQVDAAIVSSPHHTHVPITLDLVRSGIAVLCEKPLGLSVDEVESVASVSEDSGVPVAVNQTRRFIPACREIRAMLEREELGEIRSIDAREGDRFGWPAATPSMFGRSSGGKGVLLDVGVHALDLLCWWMGREPRLSLYRDDSFGGSEAAAEANLDWEGVRGFLKLSWLEKQRNSYRIEGTEGMLEWGIYDLDRLLLQSKRTGRTSTVRISGGPREYGDLATEVIRDFVASIHSGKRPAVTPRDCLASISVIEGCYLNRTRFEMPWHQGQGSVNEA